MSGLNHNSIVYTVALLVVRSVQCGDRIFSRQNQSKSTHFFKIPRGSMPPDPLEQACITARPLLLCFRRACSCHTPLTAYTPLTPQVPGGVQLWTGSTVLHQYLMLYQSTPSQESINRSKPHLGHFLQGWVDFFQTTTILKVIYHHIIKYHHNK